MNPLTLYVVVLVNYTSLGCEHHSAHCLKQGLCFPKTLMWIILVLLCFCHIKTFLCVFWMCAHFLGLYCLSISWEGSDSPQTQLPKPTESLKTLCLISTIMFDTVWCHHFLSSCVRCSFFCSFVCFAPPSLFWFFYSLTAEAK